jgi:hypothetical protein
MLEERFAALANDYLAASKLPDRRVGPSPRHVDPHRGPIFLRSQSGVGVYVGTRIRPPWVPSA